MVRSSPVAIGVVSSAVLVPLYVYPSGDAWSEVIRAKQAYPDVQVYAVVNPGNGPGVSPDPNYSSAIQQLKDEQVRTLGYVATAYGAKSLQDVYAEMDRWSQWYSPWGIFFDEVKADDAHRSYYQQVNAYAKSKRMAFTMGNPGLPVQDDYVGIFDSFVVYEGPAPASLPPLTMPASNYAMIVYGSPAVQVPHGVGYVFFTSEPEASAYSTISPLLWSLVAAVQSA